MTQQMLLPPKKRGIFSPVLIELTIVILFFCALGECDRPPHRGGGRNRAHKRI